MSRIRGSMAHGQSTELLSPNHPTVSFGAIIFVGWVNFPVLGINRALTPGLTLNTQTKPNIFVVPFRQSSLRRSSAIQIAQFRKMTAAGRPGKGGKNVRRD